jgi:hypothetical protein
MTVSEPMRAVLSIFATQPGGNDSILAPVSLMPTQAGPVIRRCPKCREPLWLSTRYPVVNGDTTRSGVALQFHEAWLCENPRCNYHELLDDPT